MFSSNCSLFIVQVQCCFTSTETVRTIRDGLIHTHTIYRNYIYIYILYDLDLSKSSKGVKIKRSYFHLSVHLLVVLLCMNGMSPRQIPLCFLTSLANKYP